VASSLIQAKDHRSGRVVAGELLQVLVPVQRDLPQEPVAHVRWYKESTTCPLEQDVWGPYRQLLRIGAWDEGVYETDPQSCPPAILPCREIIAQVGRITVRSSKDSDDLVWMTIGLDQHGTLL